MPERDIMPHPDKSVSNPLSSPNHNTSSGPQDKQPRGEVFDVDIPSLAPRRNWKKVLVGTSAVAIPLAIFGAYSFGFATSQSDKKPVPIGPFPVTKAESPKLIVNVTGQVKRPGVYTLDENARIQDAIKKAGGPLPNADLNALNLAAWAEDGSKIVVPSTVKAKPKPLPKPVIDVQQLPTETPPPPMASPIDQAPVAYNPPVTYNPPAPVTNAVAPPAPQPVAPSQSAPNPGPNLPRDKTKSGAESTNISTQYLLANPMDINSASALQLEGLPDVGPTTAARIVDYRTANGRFRTVEELDNVKGIGEKTLAKLKPYVVVR